MDNNLSENEKKTNASKVIKIFVSVVGALIFAVCSFIGGFFTGKFTLNSGAGSYEWAVNLIMKNYVGGEVTEEQLKDVSIKALSSLLDSYSTYYTAEEYSRIVAENSGSMVGAGITVTQIPQGASTLGSGVYIVEVTGNSPAWKSGLRAGSFIQSVTYGDTQTTISTTADFTQFFDTVPQGEEFEMTTDRGTFTLSRQAYTASYCMMSTSDADYTIEYDGKTSTVVKAEGGISSLPDDAAYIKLTQFYGNAVEEFGKLVSVFRSEGCTSLILDLRGNGGGYIDVMCGISGIFVGQYPNASTVATSAVFKDGSSYSYGVQRVQDSWTLPAGTRVSVLADNGTASASEALMGVLIANGVTDYGDIYISDFSEDYLAYSGTAEKDCRTYGKGIMQQTYLNAVTGEALKLTVAKIYWPDGTCIHDRGIKVEDGCVALPAYWQVTYDDEQLQSAITAIYGGTNGDYVPLSAEREYAAAA